MVKTSLSNKYFLKMSTFLRHGNNSGSLNWTDLALHQKENNWAFFNVFSCMKWERLNVSQYRGKQTIFRLTLHFLRYAAQKENNLQPFDSALTLPSRFSINYSLPINYQSTVFDSGIKYTRLCMCDSIGDVFYEFTDIHTCRCHCCPGLQRRMRRRWNENQLKWRDPDLKLFIDKDYNFWMKYSRLVNLKDKKRIQTIT